MKRKRRKSRLMPFLIFILKTVLIFQILIIATNYLFDLPALYQYNLYKRYQFSTKIINVQNWFPKSDKTRNKSDIQFIVMHHDDIADFENLPITEIAQYHKEKLNGFAYHFYIAKNGAIYNARNIAEITNHAIGYNRAGVAICLNGNFDIEEPTAMQLESYDLLLQYLRMQLSNVAIISHKETGAATNCPGKNLQNYIYENGKAKQRFFEILGKAKRAIFQSTL